VNEFIGTPSGTFEDFCNMEPPTITTLTFYHWQVG